MRLNPFLPNTGRRYAIAGSAIGALIPLAFAAGGLPAGMSPSAFFASLAASPVLCAATVVSAAALGLVAARAGRRHDRTNRLLAAERAGIAQLNHTAYHDALTGLGNRHALNLDAVAAIRPAGEGEAVATVLVVDLDRFKFINDTMGHYAGDQVLLTLARRLRMISPSDCRLYRLGGDEFLILREGSFDEVSVGDFARRLSQDLFLPVSCDGAQIDISGSIGIARLCSGGDTLQAALNRADLALYDAKAMAGGSHAFFADDMERRQRERRQMEAELKRALATGTLTVDYAPVIDAGRLEPAAFAALPSWPHAETGEVARSVFLPLAPESGLIAALDRWMIGRVVEQIAHWPETVRATLPLSAAELSRADFLPHLRGLLEQADVAPERLVFDVDYDGLAAAPSRQARDNLAALRQFGCGLSADTLTALLGGDASAASAPDFWRVDLARLELADAGATLEERVRCAAELAGALGLRLRLTGIDSEERLDLARNCAGVLAEGLASGTPMTAAEAEAFAHSTIRLPAGIRSMRGGDYGKMAASA